jgi:hypothetical protein
MLPMKKTAAQILLAVLVLCSAITLSGCPFFTSGESAYVEPEPAEEAAAEPEAPAEAEAVEGEQP